MNDLWTAPGSHSVQVYESEPDGHHVIAEFFASDMPVRDVCVMVSRPATFEAVGRQLKSGRYGPESAGIRILFFDADAALHQIMEDGLPDPVKAGGFFAHVLSQARSWQSGGTIRAYGEMADILCQGGQHAAAIQLEELAATAFAIDPRLSILCGYSMGRFQGDGGAGHLRGVCRTHGRVVPVEGSTNASSSPASPERDFETVRGVPPTHSANAASMIQDPQPKVLAKPTIYLIDDDVSVRRSLVRLLALSNWQVRAFESAEAFLAELDGLSPGGILLDMQLLGMSGLELMRRLTESGLRWPVIAMSGSQDDDTEVEALRFGARLYLHKPFEADALLETIARTL